MASPTTDRRLGLVGNIAMKAPVAAIAATNIVQSGEQTIDGVAVKAVNTSGVADRVLCIGQTDASKNGIWDVSTAAWTRAKDANGNYDLGQGSTVLVNAGTTYAGSYWKLATSGLLSIGTTLLSWTRALANSLSTLTFTQVGAGAVDRDAQDKMRDFVSILDFIPVAEHAAIKSRTSVYDCYAAIVAAITSVTYGPGQAPYYYSGPAIYFPPGQYKCNSTIELKRSVKLYGDGSGLPWGSQAELKFPAGVTGITVNRYNTLNGGVEGVPTTAADSTLLQGLRLVGTLGGAASHGVWMRAKSVIRDCFVKNFSGNGFNVVATAGGGGALEGNANVFRIEGGRSEGNTGHGLFVSGADSNAGVVIGLDCSDNTGWGIYDSSFLGNTYVGCHTSGNVLGAYKSDNINARNLFLNCYSESGQPTSVIALPSMAIGGLHGAGVTGQWISANSANMTATTFGFSSIDTFGGILFGNLTGVNSALGAFSRTGSLPWYIKSSAGRVFVDWTNFGGSEMLAFYDRNQCTPGNGYARDLSTGWNSAPIGLPLGYLGAGMVQRTEGAAAPVSTSYQSLRGDIIWNTAPTSGLPVGWVCTVAGTPGTWRSMAMVTTST